MNDDRLTRRLRAADPAADLRADPDDATGRRLRARALHVTDVADTMRRSAPRTRLVVAVAAGLLAASSVTAVAAGIFDPDPAAVDSMLAEAEEIGRHEVKTDDWRPSLRTERVICAHEDGALGSASVAHPEDFPIDERIDEADLIAVCTDADHGADGTRHLDWSGRATVCEGVMPAAEARVTVDRMTAEAGRSALVDGEVGPDRPGFPVVLGWDADCERDRIETAPESTELRPWTSTATDDFNRAREIEIGLTAAALDGCLSIDDAEALTRHAGAELAGDWAVVRGPGAGDASDACTEVRLDGQGRGIITIDLAPAADGAHDGSTP